MSFLGLIEAGVVECWRCGGCNRLIYNKDPRGYPCSGAPLPLYLNSDHSRVCSLCYEMYRTIEKADAVYWKKLPDPQYKSRPDPIHEHC